MLELGSFLRFHPSDIEHPDTGTVRAKQRRSGTAVHRCDVKKVFAPVQPHRLKFGQSRTNGGGANAVLGQVGSHTTDHVRTLVGVVNGTAGVHHHALGVGQDGKVAGVDNGARQAVQNGLRGLDQLLVGFQCAV